MNVVFACHYDQRVPLCKTKKDIRAYGKMPCRMYKMPRSE